MDTSKTITHLSLCSGYEGIGIGLQRVLPNLREIAYVEREGFPVANLVAKMEAGELDPAPVFTDVKTFPYGRFRGCVDILSGGFPCQPFSSAGKRAGTEDPRHLFPYIRDGIRACEPRIVFLENVEGIISSKTADGESVLQYVLRELEGLGYRAEAGIFSASEVGAPHQRKRVFILAYSHHKGLEGHQRNGSSEPCESIQTNTWTEGCTHFPARPGEPQHEWEQPRVTAVGDTESQQGSPSNNGGEPSAPSEPQEVQPRGGHCGSLRESNGQAEPRLGRATNGASSRVDRLRLLGNGVVPLTATKAFTTLLQRVL
ncbi:MAG: DNA cytosine methyltransferase [Opitutae bacterium]